MKRILIVGCCGSGKSTLAIALGKKLNLPVVHLDKLFWREGWVSIPQEEFDQLLLEELEKERWIIDGNYGRTMAMRLKRADTVIVLDFPTITCLWGVMKRVITNYGKTRVDMGDNCPERFDWEFLKFVATFRRKGRKVLFSRLSEVTGKEIIILKNRRQVKDFIRGTIT